MAKERNKKRESTPRERFDNRIVREDLGCVRPVDRPPCLKCKQPVDVRGQPQGYLHEPRRARDGWRGQDCADALPIHQKSAAEYHAAWQVAAAEAGLARSFEGGETP